MRHYAPLRSLTGREWAVCLAWLTLAALDDARRSPAGVLHADFGISAAILVIAGLNALFGLFKGKVDKNLAGALTGMRDAIVNFGKVLAEFAKDTGAMLARFAGLVRRFWSAVILPALRRLDGWARRLHTWLRDTFGPLLRALLWLRTKILDFYTKWFRPIFDTIDVLRRMLSLLGFLHLEFARKLDQKLAELERRLRIPLEAVIRKINEAIDVVDRVITLDGLFKRLALIRSMARDARLLVNIWHNSQDKPLTDEERRAAVERLPFPSSEEIRRDFREYLETGDGADAASIREAITDLAIQFGHAA